MKRKAGRANAGKPCGMRNVGLIWMRNGGGLEEGRGSRVEGRLSRELGEVAVP